MCPEAPEPREDDRIIVFVDFIGSALWLAFLKKRADQFAIDREEQGRDRHAERDRGIDWDRFAIDAARKDARPNETYLAGDVGIELGKVSRSGDLEIAGQENRSGNSRRDRRSLVSYALIVDPPTTAFPPNCAAPFSILRRAR